MWLQLEGGEFSASSGADGTPGMGDPTRQRRACSTYSCVMSPPVLPPAARAALGAVTTSWESLGLAGAPLGF